MLGRGRWRVGRRLAELNRILAAFAGTWFMSRNHTDVTKVIEVVKFTVEPGLEPEYFDKGALREDSTAHLQFALAKAFVHPDRRGGVDRENRIKLLIAGFEGIKMTASFTVGNHLIALLELFGQTNDATAHRNGLRFIG